MQTRRLQLCQLAVTDTAFIRNLLNSPGWIKYISNRNINNDEDALNYITKINSNPNNTYRVIFLQENMQPVGLVTLMKRDYLDHPDLGFAILPEFVKKGYAKEAAAAVIDDVIQSDVHAALNAITLADNTASVKLLESLDFSFTGEIMVEQEKLCVYTKYLK